MRYFKAFCKSFSVQFAISLIFLAGCASQSQRDIPEEEIRARADRAFTDLSGEETGSPAQYQPQSGSANASPGGSPPRASADTVPLISGKRPDWVNGRSKQFPPDRFLTAVGYGPDRPTAEDKARAEIAKIFYSDIRSSNRTYQEVLETTAGGKSSSRENINFEEITNVSTRKVLSGIRISQVYTEAAPDRQFYALAVLDRYHTENILEQKIETLDRDIQRLYSESQQQKDKLSQVQYLQLCISNFILRQAYDTELRIISPSGKGISPAVSFTEIEKRLNDVLLRDFFIALSVKGTRADEVQRALVEALNRKGFSITEETPRASVLARGTIDIQPIEQGASDWKFVRWKAYFDLVDQQGGAVFGSVQKTGKAGHLNLGQAEERAMRKMRKTLAEEISSDLTEYILSKGN